MTDDELREVGFVPAGDNGEWAFYEPGRVLPRLALRFSYISGQGIVAVVAENQVAAIPVNTIDDLKKLMKDLGLGSS